MNRFTGTLAIALTCAASLALAETEASDPNVKARQAAMKEMGATTKILGDMASGKTTFDAAKAQEAVAVIAADSTKISQLFATNAEDPASGAKPQVWTMKADFDDRADKLYQAAQGVDASSVDGLKAGMGNIGGACKSCHTNYRYD